MHVARRLRLGAYFGALIALFVLAALAGALYVHIQSDQDARNTGLRDATVASQSAARLIADGAVILENALGSVSSDPKAAADLLAHPSNCALSYAHVGAFPIGHIDVVRRGGRLVCSSSPAEASRAYTGQSWSARAMLRPGVFAPARDPATGEPVAVFSAPFPRGFAAAVVNLPAVGPDLVAQFAGSQGIEYVVTAADGRTVLAESGNPARWTGATLRSARFSRGNEHLGLDGRSRLFASAPVRGLGWRVYAGLDKSVAMASAAHLFHRELLVILGALVIVLAAAMLIHRRIARPITRFAGVLRRGGAPSSADLESLGGPAEVVDLVTTFRALVDKLEAELTERRRAEDAARAAEQAARASAETYRLLFEGNPMPMWLYDSSTLRIVEVNEAAVERYGYTREEFASMTIKDLRPPDDVPAILANLAQPPTRIERSGPWRHVKRDGSVIEVEVSSHEVNFRGRPSRLVMATDVTDRERLTRQLAQTQRLESLGQLAGGVAHDFNNLLSVILNYALFVKDELGAATAAGARLDAARADLEEIERAAQRAASLTHQLLAFARREVIHPEVISLNDVVAETEQLLRRTLGEHIELTRALSEDPWPILADSGQMSQVLVNLAVNARDAMPSGGRLVIETANVDVDKSYASTRPGLVPGRYVRLRVSDSGNGMDAATIEHAFEPFFTTKPKGAGTGLGLATVYGIVTQSGGHAQLYSESGVGTTCSIMLPATEQPAESDAPAAEREPGGHGELVLLVEDEDGIREVARRILERRGYRVLTASDGAEAIELARNHDGQIDLLITDVIMPHMLGKEVAERLTEIRPETRVMYMSGYAEPILGSGEAVPPGMVLLEKPFTEHLLLTKAREALGVVQPRA